MKKLVLLFLLLMPLALAADNTFTISFHSIGGNESISLNLVEYLKSEGPFKYSPVENLRIAIENGIATITPKDPSWRGIEDVTFAPIGVEIKVPEKKPLGALYNVTGRRNITVSKEELDTALGEVIGQSFYVIAGNLTAEPVNISGFLSNSSLSLDINKEISLNISLKKNRKSLNPEFLIDVHNKNANLSLAEYKEPSQLPFYLLIALFAAAAITVFAYFYTGYAQDVLGAVVTRQEAVEKKSVSSALKRSVQVKLSALQERVAKNPEGVLKEAMGLANEFFSDYFHITSVSKEKVIEKIASKGIDGSLEAGVLSLYDDYAGMAYGKKEISKKSVSAFISKASGIIRKC